MRLAGLLLSITLSFAAGAATPPAESRDRMDGSFPNIAFATPAGELATLSEYRGKVVVVKLWATWCMICRAKWPHHQALYDAVKNHADVELITLSVFENPADSQAWVDKQGYDVPLFINLINNRGAVKVADAPDYFIQGTPMVFLIDKQGNLRKKVIGSNGSITESDIRQWM